MATRAPTATYGVLVGDVKDGMIDPTGATPHYEIWVKAKGVNYRAAVNVISQDSSEVLAYLDPAYVVPAGTAGAKKLDLAALAAGAQSFQALKTGAEGTGLAYLTDGLFPLDQMKLIPDQGSGVTLKNLLDGQIERAKADADAIAIVFGEFFQDPTPDKQFGFSPERGVHNIHLMQGDSGSFEKEDRINGDGALFLRFTGGETVALFVRFQSQDVGGKTPA